MAAQPAVTNIEDQENADELLTAEEYVRGAASAALLGDGNARELYREFFSREIGVVSAVGVNVEDHR